MTGMRCWLCGAEPDRIVVVTSFGDPEPRYMPGQWPPTTDGHQHAVEKPTPGQLEQAGHDTLMRIRHAAT